MPQPHSWRPEGRRSRAQNERPFSRRASGLATGWSCRSRPVLPQKGLGEGWVYPSLGLVSGVAPAMAGAASCSVSISCFLPRVMAQATTPAIRAIIGSFFKRPSSGHPGRAGEAFTICIGLWGRQMEGCTAGDVSCEVAGAPTKRASAPAAHQTAVADSVQVRINLHA